MDIIDTKIEDVKLIKPLIHGDDRGFFSETFLKSWFKSNIGDIDFVQENHSKSSRNVLRGLHYQTNNTQGKLVRVTSGEVFDVAVDLRKGSKTFGMWVGEYLSASDGLQLWVPEGFAHGFLVLSDYAEFLYKCTNYYDPDSEISIKYDDPEINIDWPIEVEPSLSSKDKKGLSFFDAPKF